MPLPKNGSLVNRIALMLCCVAVGAIGISPKISAPKQVAITSQDDSGKISKELRQRSTLNDSVDVFILLTSQPQRRILDEKRELYRPRVAFAEKSIQAATEQANASKGDVDAKLKELDDIILQMRQEAAREIETEVAAEQQSVQLLLEGLGAKAIQRYNVVNALAAQIPSWSISQLAEHPSVARILSLGYQTPSLDISVPSLGTSSFWSSGFLGTSQRVAVLDSGIKSNHPAFSTLPIVDKPFLTNGSKDACFSANETLTGTDNQGHGTSVAGIVGSRGSGLFDSNKQGVARGLGILYNYKIAYLLSANCQQSGVTGGSNPSDAISALNDAVNNTSVEIFNYSYGDPNRQVEDDGFAQIIDDIIANHNITFIVSAGNTGPKPSTIESPGMAYNIISVANIDDHNTVNRADDTVLQSSSQGPTVGGRRKPDIAAPGTLISTTQYDWDGGILGLNADYGNFSGTSAAAPHIAGAVALLRQAGVTNALARKAILLNSTDTTGWTADRGWGYLDLSRTFSQQNLYFTDAVTARFQSGPFKLYFIPLSIASQLTATLVWNRHVDTVNGVSQFHDLDLALFEENTNTLRRSSTSTIQNVEQVSITGISGPVLKVKCFSSSFAGGITSEPFALASSISGFSAAIGPRFSYSFPTLTVSPQQQFTVTIQITNTGDLSAHNTTANLVLPAGFSIITGANPRNIGKVAPSGIGTSSWTISASQSPGIFTADVTVSSSSYGETFSSSASANWAVNGPLPAVTTGVASGVTTSGATLNGQVNPNGSASTGWFEWSTNSNMTGATQTTHQSVGSGTLSQPTSAVLTGLQAATPYFFRAVASNAGGTNSGSVTSFTTGTPTQAPAVTTGVASGITTSGATLNGQVNPNGSATTGWFEWSTSSSMTGASQTTHQSVGSGTLSQPITATLTGLQPATTYFFRAVASNTGGANSGSVTSIITPSQNQILSVNSTNPASGVQISINPLDLNNLGSGTTPLSRIYRTGTTVTLTASNPAANGNAFGSWTNCPAAIVNVCTITMVGDTTVSANYTLPPPPPSIATTSASNITASSATLNGTVSMNGTPGDAFFRWGTDVTLATFNETFHSQLPGSATNLAFSNTPMGLQSSTTYFFRAVATNGITTVQSFILSFTTLATTRVLTVASANPANGVSIAVTPNDNSGLGNGSTQFTRTYNNGAPVTITAPAIAGGNNFSSWSGCDSINAAICSVTLNANRIVTANYLSLAPLVSLSPANLIFTSQLVGSTSSNQAITLSNPGNATLNITGISPSGDFISTQPQQCGTSLDASKNCTINITFTPSAAGLRTGTLSISSNAVGSPHKVNLSGAGFDLSVTPQLGSSMSQTISAGQQANFNLSFAPISGLTVPIPALLSCTLAQSIQAANCAINPGSVNLGTSAANFTVNISTTRHALLWPRIERPPRWPLWFGLFCSALLMILAVAVRLRPHPTHRRIFPALAPLATVALAMLLVNCGGGGGGSGPPSPPIQPFTAPGTYAVTVTATVQGASRTINLTLVVQ